MRIGMVTACYKPVMNGVTRMVALYKETMEAAGHEVTVFTLGEPDPEGDEPGVVRTPGIPLGDTGYYLNFRYTREAQERLREMDIVHCHHLFMSVEMAHRYGNCPILYTNHTRYDLYTGAYSPLPQPAADAIMRQVWPEFTSYCDVIVTPSASVRDVMREFGVTQRIEIIPNGINLEPFRNPPNPHVRETYDIPSDATLLIYTGRIAAEKGLDKLVAQFALAREVLPDLYLLLVGKGPYLEKLRQLVTNLRLDGAVGFAGAVPYNEVGNLLAMGDIYITASVSEVHPLSVIEAMAAGLPIVAISSPGISDTVTSGEQGVLASRPEALAAAIAALASNKQWREDMGSAAKEASEQYDIRRTVSQTLDLYRELRQSRPDLNRQRQHGRSVRRSARPILEQLGSLLRPPE
jgi:glycosyltransferase involved in cell wall biosynthesis